MVDRELFCDENLIKLFIVLFYIHLSNKCSSVLAQQKMHILICSKHRQSSSPVSCSVELALHCSIKHVEMKVKSCEILISC